MTKSTITRERLQELAEGQSGFNLRTATHEESQELARMALAAMDSEPVAWRRFQETPTDGGYWILYDNKPNCSGVESLYRPAQPAPVVPEEWAIADAVNFCKETGRQDAGAAMDAWNACRAAMLNGGKS